MVRFTMFSLIAGCCLIASSTAQAQVKTEAAPAKSGDADEMMMMKKMMMDPSAMMMAKKSMMSDDKMASMMAREMLIQELMHDKDVTMAMQKDMMSAKEDPAMMKAHADKVMMAKSAMMKDKQAMESMMHEIMMRHMVADKMSKMMKSDAPMPRSEKR